MQEGLGSSGHAHSPPVIPLMASLYCAWADALIVAPPHWQLPLQTSPAVMEMQSDVATHVVSKLVTSMSTQTEASGLMTLWHIGLGSGPPHSTHWPPMQLGWPGLAQGQSANPIEAVSLAKRAPAALFTGVAPQLHARLLQISPVETVVQSLVEAHVVSAGPTTKSTHLPL